MPVLHPVQHQKAGAGEYSPDLSSVDEFSRQPSSSAEKGIRRAAELETAPFSLSDQRVAMFSLGTERFLTENVFSRAQGCLTYGEVRHRHRQVHHDVNIRARQQSIDAAGGNTIRCRGGSRRLFANVRASDE